MEPKEIKDFKHYVVNLILKVGLIVLFIADIALIARDFPNVFSLQNILQNFFLFILFILVIFKHKISFSFKVGFIVWAAYLIIILGLVYRGFIASSKFYIILIPVISSLIVSYKKSIALLALFIITYLVIGFLISNNTILNKYSVLDIRYISWISEAVIIFLGGFTILYIGNNYNKKLNLNHIEILNKNKELEKHRNNLEVLINIRTEDLKTTYERLKSTNKELSEKNEIIHEQNTELKATLQHLKQAQSQLIQAEKMASLGTLTAGIAHEINNPLNYIMGAYYNLTNIHKENTYKENTDKIGLILDSLRTGVERSSNIIKGLNQFSRSSRALDEKCNVHSIIDNCLNILYNKIKHRIKVNKQYYVSDIVVKGNVGDLHQVFINIILNAIDAIISEGTINILTKVENKNAIIAVTDTGEGISPENLNKITDPFFTTKAPGKGIGLGLSISYNIVSEHNGTMEFISELGKGTSVIIKLLNYG